MSGLAKALTEDQVLLRVMERLHEQIDSQHETIKFLMEKRIEQRKWVGLTLEELERIGKAYEEKDGKIRAWANFADHIEQKLKEKNGG